MNVKTIMDTANIIAIFKELSDADKANVMALLTEEMPKPTITRIKTNIGAYNQRVTDEVAKCVTMCSDLANKGIDRTYYTMPRGIREDVMEKLGKHGIYRMSLSNINASGDNVEVRLTWD